MPPTDPFRLIQPPAHLAVPVLVDSPHSGEIAPEGAGFIQPESHWRRSADLYVDRLIAGAVQAGATVLAATFPRVYIDPNRAPDDIDPAALAGEFDGPMNPSQRARDGWGLCWTRCGPELLDLYAAPLSGREIRHRLDSCWTPYHACLDARIDELVSRWGHAIHLNFHSMPWGVSTRDSAAPDRIRPDVDLGDRNGQSCDPRLTDLVARAFEGGGLRVERNGEFTGGYIVERIGRPQRRIHSIQIEINRRLILTDNRADPHPDLWRTAQLVDRVIAQVCRAAVSGDW